VEILPTDIFFGINALEQINAVIHCAKGELLIDNKKVNCIFKKRTEFENDYKALFSIVGTYRQLQDRQLQDRQIIMRRIFMI
jgi:hypothetical protein